MKKKKEIFRHWGSNKFNRDLFIPIFNRPLSNKPFGGLWSSPTKDVDIDWGTWCKNNDFRLDTLKEHFDFTLKDNANILVLKEVEDLIKLPRIDKNSIEDESIREILKHDTMNMDIDFDKLTKEYDGILVYMYRGAFLGLDREIMYYELYGWDVDTLLVFNPDIIEEVNYAQKE